MNARSRDEIENLNAPQPATTFHWQWRSYGFDFGGSSSSITSLRDEFQVIPHWLIVIPLTLLSAWLLLSKPRPAKKLVPPLSPDPDHA